MLCVHPDRPETYHDYLMKNTAKHTPIKLLLAKILVTQRHIFYKQIIS